MSNATKFCKVVSEAASGQLETILAKLGVDSSDAMHGRHFALPGCLKVKGRFSDPTTGEGGCDCGCGKRWGDAVAFVKHCLNLPYQMDAAKWVAEAIDRKDLLPAETALKPEQRSPSAGLRLTPFIDVHARPYVEANAGISIDGIKKLSPRMGIKNKTRAICFPVYSNEGTKKPPVNYISVRVDGLKYQWEENGEPKEFKKLTQKNCRNGILGSVEHIDRLTSGIVSGCRILITAGPSDLAAAHSVGIPEGIIAITQAFGERAIPSDKPDAIQIVDLIASTGCEILIAYDTDETGKAASEKLAKHFAGRGRVAKAIDLSRLDLPGKDIRDFIAAGATIEQVIALADTTETAEPEANTDGRTQVQWTDNELTLVEQTIEAISDSENIYQRCGKLLDVVEGPHPQAKDETTLTIWDMESAYLRTLITSRVRYYKTTDDGEKRSKTITDTFANQVLKHRRYPKIRNLVGVNSHPFMRPGGSICTADGYDNETGVYLKSSVDINVPDFPSFEQAQQAARRLLGIVREFDFKKDSHRSSWLAGLLTVFARPAIKGPVPVFIIEASQQGSGKTRLVDIVSNIAIGRGLVRGGWDGKETETAKSLLSVLMSGVSLVLYDNVKSRIGGDTLEAIVTGETFSGRILGETRHTPELPIRQVFFFTSNNCVVTPDIARRACFVRLEPSTDDPAARSFEIEDILGHVREHRNQFASDAMTILRAFVLAKPSIDIPAWGGFEAWSNLVRAAIVWIGEADPYESTSEKKQTVNADDIFPELFHSLNATFSAVENQEGVTSKEILKSAKLQYANGDYINQDLRDALHTACGDKNLTTVRIGQILHRFDGKIIRWQDEEKKIERVNKFFSTFNANKKIKTWHIGEADAGVCPIAGVYKKQHPHPTPASLDPQNTGQNQFAGIAGVFLEGQRVENGTSSNGIHTTQEAYIGGADFDPRNTRTPANSGGAAPGRNLPPEPVENAIAGGPCPLCGSPIVSEITFDGRYENFSCSNFECDQLFRCRKIEEASV